MVKTRKTLTPTNTLQMQTALRAKPHSLDDLTAVAGLAKGTVTRFVRELQAGRMVHIAAWGRDTRGYPTIKKYAMGDKPDALCPKKNETSAVRMAALRAKRKKKTAAARETRLRAKLKKELL